MKSTERNNNFLIQGSILAFASIIVRIIGFIYRIPMTRIIGNEGMGFYESAFQIYNIALILSSYSLPIAVSKLVAARNVNKEHRNSYRVFLCSMIFAVSVGLIASLIVFFGADYFPAIINNDPDPKAGLALKVLAPTIFVFSIMGVFRGFFQGKNTMIPTAVSQIIEQIINAIVSVIACYWLIKNYSASASVAAYGAAGGTLGTLLGALSGLLFLVFVFLIYKPVLNKQLRHDKTGHRESYGDIFKVIILTISPIILSQTVYHISGVLDQSLFGHIMATKEISAFDSTFLGNTVVGQLYSPENRRVLYGVYSSKYRVLTNLPVSIASAIGAATITSIAAAKGMGDDGLIRSKVHVAIKFNMLIAIPSAVGMAVLASPILKLLFNDGSDMAANLIKLGSISIIFYSFSTVTTSMLQGINKLKIPVINAAISLLIHILLVFLLLKFTPFSTYALVIGNVVFAMVNSFLNWYSLSKYVDYKQEMMKSFVIPLISSGLMGLAAFLTYKGLYIITERNAISVIIAIFISVLVYFGFMIYLKGIDEAELKGLPRGSKVVKLLKKIHLM